MVFDILYKTKNQPIGWFFVLSKKLNYSSNNPLVTLTPFAESCI